MASRMRSRSFRVGQKPVQCFKDVFRKIRKRCNTIQIWGAATSPIKFAHNVDSVEIILNSFNRIRMYSFVLIALFKSIPILTLFANSTLNGQLSDLPTPNQAHLTVKILT